MAPSDKTPYDHLGAVSPDPEAAEILQDVADQGVLPPEIDAQKATAAVLCVLSRRLSGGEARELLDNLPPSVQALMQPCAAHAEEAEPLGTEGFTRRIGEHLDVDPVRSASIARAVFAAVKKKLPEKQEQDIVDQLPEELQALWGSAK